ncbi:MAG: transcription/translation regulatory transformer protein RfaH, partial [Pseudomonadota bacterium]
MSAPSTIAWYLVHTKPRQEDIALMNLERQGYTCYLPRLSVEKARRRRA